MRPGKCVTACQDAHGVIGVSFNGLWKPDYVYPRSIRINLTGLDGMLLPRHLVPFDFLHASKGLRRAIQKEMGHDDTW